VPALSNEQRVSESMIVQMQQEILALRQMILAQSQVQTAAAFAPQQQESESEAAQGSSDAQYSVDQDLNQAIFGDDQAGDQ